MEHWRLGHSRKNAVPTIFQTILPLRVNGDRSERDRFSTGVREWITRREREREIEFRESTDLERMRSSRPRILRAICSVNCPTYRIIVRRGWISSRLEINVVSTIIKSSTLFHIVRRKESLDRKGLFPLGEFKKVGDPMARRWDWRESGVSKDPFDGAHYHDSLHSRRRREGGTSRGKEGNVYVARQTG